MDDLTFFFDNIIFLKVKMQRAQVGGWLISKKVTNQSPLMMVKFVKFGFLMNAAKHFKDQRRISILLLK